MEELRNGQYPSTSSERWTHVLAADPALWNDVESGNHRPSSLISNLECLCDAVTQQSNHSAMPLKCGEIFTHIDNPLFGSVVKVSAFFEAKILPELLASIETALRFDLTNADPLPGRSIVSTRLPERCNTESKRKYTYLFGMLNTYMHGNNLGAVLQVDGKTILLLPLAVDLSGDGREKFAARLFYGCTKLFEAFVRVTVPYIPAWLEKEEEREARERAAAEAAAESAAEEAATRRKQLKEETATRRIKREAEEEAARLSATKKTKHSNDMASGVVSNVSPIGSSPDSSARDSDSSGQSPGVSPLPQLVSSVATKEESSDDGALSDNEILEQLLPHFVALRLRDPNNVESRMLRKYTELLQGRRASSS